MYYNIVKIQFQGININITMANLKQIFLNTLNEAPVPAPAEREFDQAEDEAALQKRLATTETDPTALDVDPGPENVGYHAEVATAEGWLIEIDAFIKYLNDTEEGSINAQINVLDRDNSVFKGIASRTSDKFARVSSDLAELKEIIAGFIISSDRKAKTIRMQDSLVVSQLPINEQVIEKLSRYGFEVVGFNEKNSTYSLTLEGYDDTILRAEVNEGGNVNGENVELYLERITSEYEIEPIIIEESVIEEDLVMDEKILKQIKDIDEKLTHGWNQDLYSKRRELLDKMQKPYIDVAKSLMNDGE